MGTLEDPDILMSAGGRWLNWLDALRSVPDFPVAGTGLGTYRDIYLMYQDRWAGVWHFYAENQYLQALTDAGIVGLVLLIAILLVVLVQAFRLMSVSQTPSVVHPALGYALLFALITQGVHAFFDYGLYFPPAMTLLAVMSGASIVRRKTQSSAHTTDVEVRRVRVPIFALVLLAAGVNLNYDLYLSAVVRDAIIEYRHIEALGDATDEEIAESIRALTPFAELRPDDAELQYQIGKLHMHGYRNARFVDLRANAPIDVTVEQLWDASAPAYANEENSPGSDHTEHNQQLDHLELAKAPLLAARRVAPVLAKVHLRLAAVVAATEGLEAGAAHVERAVRCEPSDTYKLSEAGRLHLVAARAEDAFKLWRRSLTLNSDRLPEILRWSSELTDEQLVGEILPLDSQFLPDFSQRSGIARDRPALPRTGASRPRLGRSTRPDDIGTFPPGWPHQHAPGQHPAGNSSLRRSRHAPARQCPVAVRDGRPARPSRPAGTSPRTSRHGHPPRPRQRHLPQSPSKTRQDPTRLIPFILSKPPQDVPLKHRLSLANSLRIQPINLRQDILHGRQLPIAIRIQHHRQRRFARTIGKPPIRTDHDG
jgi:hypothetical protein